MILYSFKDVKTVQSITHRINETFEEDLFDAYVALPSTRQTKNLTAAQFMSEEEHRGANNCYMID